MNTSLKEQLDELAEQAVGDRTLDHPAFVTPSRAAGSRSQGAFALAACLVVGLLITGAWLLQRSPSEVDTAGQATRQPIPALLLEEPVPLSDLTPELREAFVDQPVRGPLASIDSGLVATFDGVHVVERDDVTVVVGLDIDGSILCIATERTGADGQTSSCGSVAGFMANESQFIGQTFDTESRVVVMVPNDVVAVEVGTTTAPVERNIAVVDAPLGDVLNVVYADGRVEPTYSIPDADAEGRLVLDGETIDIASVGCAAVDGQFHAEAAFVDTDTLLSATITTDGVVLAGGTDGEEVDVVDTSAELEIDETSGTLIVSATWSSDARSGTITVDCGERFLDLSAIR